MTTVATAAREARSAPITPLTDDERSTFMRDGYLIIRNVLSAEEVDHLRRRAERLAKMGEVTNAVLREELYHRNSYKLTNVFNMTRDFDFLLDHPRVFGKLVSLIGWHIQLMGCELFIRGPSETQLITGFHTDLGQAQQQILPTPENLMLQVKAQFFLTDLSAPDSGNFLLIPGSHVWRVADQNPDCLIGPVNDSVREGKNEFGYQQVLVQPGDVLIFPWSLWHAVGPNTSGRTRVSVTLRYGQLALRPIDNHDTALRDERSGLTPRQRRVLGDVGPGHNYWKLPDQRDVISGNVLELMPDEMPATVE